MEKYRHWISSSIGEQLSIILTLCHGLMIDEVYFLIPSLGIDHVLCFGQWMLVNVMQAKS